jgi:hypothetical protein
MFLVILYHARFLSGIQLQFEENIYLHTISMCSYIT